MDISTAKITRNTSLFTLALILQKLISFVYFSIIAVKIGAANLGSYSFALYFTTIFAVLIDIGISNVLVREVSKKPEQSQIYLSGALALKIPLALFSYALVVVLINLMGNPPLIKQLVYLAGVIMALDSFTLTFYAFLRARQNLRWESLGTVIFQIIVFASGLIVISLTRDLRWLIMAVLLASLFNFLFSGFLVRVWLGLKFFTASSKEFVKKLFFLTLPFALAAVFTRVYGYLDTVLLHQLINPSAAGFYSLPYKITFSLQFMPMAFIATLYPAFAYSYSKSIAEPDNGSAADIRRAEQAQAEEKERLSRLFEKSLVYLCFIAIPITLGLIALAKPLILTFYTAEYAPSILTLQILAASLPLLFLNFPLGSLLNACDRQTRNTAHIGIVMVVNAVLNIILIPKYSYLGAAVASGLSTLLMFCLQAYVAGQIVKISSKFLFEKIFPVIVAGLAMFAALEYFKATVHFLILIPVGAIIYFVSIMFLNGDKPKAVWQLLKTVIGKQQ